MIDFDNLLLRTAHTVFGETVTWIPASGPAQSVTGVFNEHNADLSFEDGTEVSTTRPIVNVRESVLSGAALQGDLFRIRGRLYQVTDVKPDGHGDLRIDLRAATNAEAARASLPPIAPVVP